MAIPEYNTVAEIRAEIWGEKISTSRQNRDRRADNEERNTKRQRLENSVSKPFVLPKPFSEEEIAAEERRPKHKVAVMIGYSGTGYKGMQINTTEKTIEGDLFTAFIAASAISKANANDPKKSALVRCARTDKGVHAAGNVISLKLIDDDPDIVSTINQKLPPQIRVWGIQRTTGSFSCYQACDSRWYEYLIPSHAFLPPHPCSWFGQKLIEIAKECDDEEAYMGRQAEVADFWKETEAQYIKPIVDSLDEAIKLEVIKALYDLEDTKDPNQKDKETAPQEQERPVSSSIVNLTSKYKGDNVPGDITELKSVLASTTTDLDSTTHANDSVDPAEARRQAVQSAAKRLRGAYQAAKRAYRISEARLDRIRTCLKAFVGTHNFHNYTIEKGPRDSSAKRVIKSFELAPEPLIINGTEWLSLKIHGQSFMMHQIRKMIGMIALVVRCGRHPSIIQDSMEPSNKQADVVVLAIPKVPGLGLLLERPVFDSYNDGPATKFERTKIDFANYEKEIAEFKQREIYERIFREEEEGDAFHTFFASVDALKNGTFLYLTSKGVEAVSIARNGKQSNRKIFAPELTTGVDSDDDGKDAEEDERAGNEG